jgi:hypothetical protein
VNLLDLPYAEAQIPPMRRGGLMKKRLLAIVGLVAVISMITLNCFISDALARGGSRGGGGHSRGGGSYKGSHSKGGDTSVRGYTRKDGTYVQPHMRTAPNSSKLDNYSTKGNVNPYTGKEGTQDPFRK